MSDPSNNSINPPESIWRTAVGRSELEFGSLLHTPIREFLVSTEHIQALTIHRDKLTLQGAIFFFVSVFIAFLIHLNHADLSVSLNSPFGEIANLPISTEVLLFALSATTSYYGLRFVSAFMLTKQLNTILDDLGHPSHSGMMATEHVAARWATTNLWTDVMMIRISGYRSGALHVGFILLTLLLLILITLSQLAIILSASYVGMNQLLGAGRPVIFWLVVVPSVVATHLALVLPLLAITVPMKFTIRGSDVAEKPSGPSTS